MATMDILLRFLLNQFIAFSQQYPEAILKFEYDPKLAIRGLHYDIIKGLLLKIDSMIQVLNYHVIISACFFIYIA